jgi:hypothetical protein
MDSLGESREEKEEDGEKGPIISERPTKRRILEKNSRYSEGV